MLAGFGYSGHDYANCTVITGTPSHTITNHLSIKRTSFAGLLQDASPKELEGDMLDWREGGATAEPIVLKSVMPLRHSHNQHETQAPMAKFPPGRKDPFDLESFFDGGVYGNDGQPFALKIHISQDATSSGAVYHGGNSRRCRGSGRC